MSPMYGEKRKVVTFSLDKERELFDLASAINFSAFVKRHLSAELKRQQGVGKSELVVNLKEGNSNA